MEFKIVLYISIMIIKRIPNWFIYSDLKIKYLTLLRMPSETFFLLTVTENFAILEKYYTVLECTARALAKNRAP
jgi:hypothetical protein